MNSFPDTIILSENKLSKIKPPEFYHLLHVKENLISVNILYLSKSHRNCLNIYLYIGFLQNKVNLREVTICQEFCFSNYCLHHNWCVIYFIFCTITNRMHLLLRFSTKALWCPAEPASA